MTGLAHPPDRWEPETAKAAVLSTLQPAAIPSGVVKSIADTPATEPWYGSKDGFCAPSRQEGSWWGASALRGESEMALARDINPLPLDCGEYIGSTTLLTTEQHGACLLILMATWSRPLRDDDEVLARVSRTTKTRFVRHIRPAIEQYFEIADGYWCQNGGFIADPNNGRLPAAEWSALRTEIFRRDKFTCTYCGAVGVRLECDHVMPVCRGGSNEPSNLTTACLECNRAKGGLTLEEWRALS
jgi:hypothetical protein